MESLTPHQQLETAESLAWIGLRISEDPELTRYRLAKEACERFEWRDACGRPKEMACRKRLIRPGAARQAGVASGATGAAAAAIGASTGPGVAEVSCALADLGTITLQPVERGTAAGPRLGMP